MVTSASAVKEAVKETVLGSDEPSGPTSQSKARFTRMAIKDAETGELFMGPDEFINAVAPDKEDFVSLPSALSRPRRVVDVCRRGAMGRVCAGLVTSLPGVCAQPAPASADAATNRQTCTHKRIPC